MNSLPLRLTPIVLLAAINFLIFNRYFPLSEGWWETYGYLNANGLTLYKDVDLAFPPLFSLFSSFLMNTIGLSFFEMRLLGVIVLLASVIILQLTLERFFSTKASAISILVASILFISAPQFIAKDYHIYQLLLVSICLYLYSFIIGKSNRNITSTFAIAITLGIFVCLVTLMKQNVGLLLLVSFLISLVIFLREFRGLVILAFIIGFIATLIFAFPLLSLKQVFIGNDAKGPITTVLFRVLTDKANRDTVSLAILYYFVYLISRNAWPTIRRIFTALLEPIEQRNITKFFGVILGLYALSVLLNEHATLSFQSKIIPFSLSVLIIFVHHLATNRSNIAAAIESNGSVIFILPLLALAYSNTNTASFDFNGMYIPIAFALGFTLDKAGDYSDKLFLLISLLLVALVPRIAIDKIQTPYAWWGSTQAPIFSAKFQTDYPQLSGIYVDETYRDIFNDIKQLVDTNSQGTSDVYFYDLPIFYLLHHKFPPFRAVIQWFDVITTAQMQRELTDLRQHPPRLIVAFDPMPAAYSSHRQLRHSGYLPQEEFRDLLDAWLADGKYKLVRNIALPNSNAEEFDASNSNGDSTFTFVLLNSAYFNKEVRLLADAVKLKQRNLSFIMCYRDGMPLLPTPNLVLHPGDQLILKGSKTELMKAQEYFGISHDPNRNWNSVLVLQKAE